MTDDWPLGIVSVVLKYYKFLDAQLPFLVSSDPEDVQR